MLKKENGIGMVALFVVIIIIIAIIAVAVYIGHSAVRAKDLEDLKTDLLRVQAKVKVKAEEYHGKKEENALVGEEPSEEILNKVGIAEMTDKVKVLSQEDLDQMGLADMEADKQYVVDYEDQEIYWVNGYKTKEGNVYYKLSEIENLSEEILPEEKQEEIVPEEEEKESQLDAEEKEEIKEEE